MMEMMYELKTIFGDCHLFDFFEEAKYAMAELVASGKYRPEELFINPVVSE